MPDVDAMIDEITARATDPNRNPNVGNAGRGNSGRDQDDDDREVTEPRENQRKSARDRINERNRNRTPTSNSRSALTGDPNVPVIVPRGLRERRSRVRGPVRKSSGGHAAGRFPVQQLLSA